MLTLQNVIDAKKRLAPYVVRTPLLRVPALDKDLGCQVYLKFEGFQIIGAFKIRGAMNKALTLTPEQLACGVICGSSGNHAQGVACAAQRLGAKAKIVMPASVNPVKLAGVKSFGGEVELVNSNSSTVRQERVDELVKEYGYVNIHPYADPEVAAGQGTIGLEITEDLPDVNYVAVPIGGGGLISGIATAVKGTSKAQVIGCEPSGAPRYGKSREAGKPVSLGTVTTICDATRTDTASPLNFENIEDKVDTLVTAEDETVLKAMKLLLQKAKITAEPSSSLPVAAALEHKLPVRPEDKVVFVVSSGNADPALVAKLLSE